MAKHWELKKNRNPLVTTKSIIIFIIIIKNGTIGGKVLGAGWGIYFTNYKKTKRSLKNLVSIMFLLKLKTKE